MEQHWSGYQNGVSLGGAFVIENWMFFRRSGEVDPSTLQLAWETKFDNLAWSEALLRGDVERAYAIVDCHLHQFYSDADLDSFARFGINAVRLPVGYWLFDDPTLYPGDAWKHKPTGQGKYGAYGVNPDGFVTPGTEVLTDLVLRLWNRNIKVLIDMHALPGCSSPHQSYAGVWCEPKAPNTWNGEAHDGISGGHEVGRADDGKTWSDVSWKIALERVVPWIKFVEGLAPGAIAGYELVNEPDIASADATVIEVRSLTVDLGSKVLACLGDLADSVWIGISTASKNVPSTTVAHDYTSHYGAYKGKFNSDIHHYFNWAGCIDYGAKTFSVQCVCESNLPGTSRQYEDVDWARWMQSGVLDQGWRFYVGEWSAALGTAHNCQNGVPTTDQARSLWRAQKWGYLSQYMHYRGKAVGGSSSFVGDYYWNGRMGHNWNPDPAVCAGPSSATHYADFKFWDWSLLRLIALGIAEPLSQMAWTPESIAGKKWDVCTGTISVLCTEQQVPHIQGGGQPGMTRLNAQTALDVAPGARAHASSMAGLCCLCTAAALFAVTRRRRAPIEASEAAQSLVEAPADADEARDVTLAAAA